MTDLRAQSAPLRQLPAARAPSPTYSPAASCIQKSAPAAGSAVIGFKMYSFLKGKFWLYETAFPIRDLPIEDKEAVACPKGSDKMADIL